MFYETMDGQTIHYIREDFHKQQKFRKNLSVEEISELERYYFEEAPSRISEEVRMYYLDVKSGNPSSADRMLTRTNFLLARGIYSVDDIEDLCRVIAPYYINFTLHYERQGYGIEFHTGNFIKQ